MTAQYDGNSTTTESGAAVAFNEEDLKTYAVLFELPGAGPNTPQEARRYGVMFGRGPDDATFEQFVITQLLGLFPGTARFTIIPYIPDTVQDRRVPTTLELADQIAKLEAKLAEAVPDENFIDFVKAAQALQTKRRPN
jgi:hypothetical protein